MACEAMLVHGVGPPSLGRQAITLSDSDTAVEWHASELSMGVVRRSDVAPSRPSQGVRTPHPASARETVVPRRPTVNRSKHLRYVWDLSHSARWVRVVRATPLGTSERSSTSKP